MWRMKVSGTKLSRKGCSPGRVRGLVLATVAVALAGGVAMVLWRGPDRQVAPEPLANLLETDDAEVFDPATVARIEAFCGDCHAVPLPDSFPRYAWHTEVLAGYEFYAKSGRTDLDPPPLSQTVAYYRSRAPETMVFPLSPPPPASPRVTFEIEKLETDSIEQVTPAVAHLKWAPLDQDARSMLIVTDMRRGCIKAVDLSNTRQSPRLLAQLKHPCHVEVCDLDQNGTLDLLVSDLGSFPPGDHTLGRVVWLSRRENEELYDPVVIGSGLGRVADARAADFDRDGDLDVIVAVFGMDRSGSIELLRNVTGEEDGDTVTAAASAAVDRTTLRFRRETVDPRPGGIHVPPYDFNDDGYLDFAALISQEYEQVALFINQHGAEPYQVPFVLQTLWGGPDLTFGMSGMELVDLDQDGDIDIVFTNGDAFDNGFVNPRHGVQWLENLGRLRFEYHRLADLTGAYVAPPADYDLDGDLDMVVASWMPSGAQPANVYDQPRASVVYLEQVAPRTFQPYTLEQNANFHAAMEVGDFDADGDLDFVVGYHSLTRSEEMPYWIAIWWNQLRKPQADGADAAQ